MKAQLVYCGILLMLVLALFLRPGLVRAADEVLPRHITPETLKAVRSGLDFLARTQAPDGAWHDGESYPVAVTSLAGMAFLAHGDTPSRGRYAPQLRSTADFLSKCSTRSGLITGSGQELGRPMHGHGFALLFLSSTYGMVKKETLRVQMKKVIDNGVSLTARGQSGYGVGLTFPARGTRAPSR